MSELFETRDHELASTLTTLGHEIHNLRWEFGGEMGRGKPFAIFVFEEDRETLEPFADEFFIGKVVKISPKELFENHKRLRNWIYEGRERMRGTN